MESHDHAWGERELHARVISDTIQPKLPDALQLMQHNSPYVN